MKYQISPLADRDLEEIWNHIARDNVDAANRVDAALHNAMLTLAKMPGMGHARPDVKGYRFWKVYSYLIAYRVENSMLVVVRVIHGARELRRAFERGD